MLPFLESLADVEGLLGLDGDKTSLNKELLRNGALIDRVVTQFTELRFHAARLQESALVRALQPRIARLETAIEVSWFLIHASTKHVSTEDFQNSMGYFGTGWTA